MRSYQKRAMAELERRRKDFEAVSAKGGYTAPGRTKLKKR